MAGRDDTEKGSGMQYWLLKSEPRSYSIDDLARDGTTLWDGVRNYQARNFIRDKMRVGDQVLFYHSSIHPPCVVGVVEVCSAPYPDPTAFDERDPHYDPRSKKDDPTWYVVDVAFKQKFKEPISLEALKADPALADMLVVRRGQRLSVQPVEQEHFEHIMEIARST